MGEPTAEDLQMVADGLMTIAEASDFLKVGKTKLYELMESGLLEYCLLVGSRRIPKNAAIKYAATCLAKQD